MKDEICLTRKQLATRWQCSTETIKRKEKKGLLIPLRIGLRLVRYRLADIQQVEMDALSHAQ